MHGKTLYDGVEYGLKDARKAEALFSIEDPIEEKRLTLHANRFLRDVGPRGEGRRDGSEFIHVSN